MPGDPTCFLYRAQPPLPVGCVLQSKGPICDPASNGANCPVFNLYSCPSNVVPFMARQFHPYTPDFTTVLQGVSGTGEVLILSRLMADLRCSRGSRL